MIAPALPADPLDRVDLVVDQDAEQQAAGGERIMEDKR